MKHPITIEIDAADKMEAALIESKIKRIAKLPAADLDRFDQIASNPKALKGLADKWNFLKSMFS